MLSRTSMDDFTIGLAVGLFAGVFIGMCVAALFFVNKGETYE